MNCAFGKGLGAATFTAPSSDGRQFMPWIQSRPSRPAVSPTVSTCDQFGVYIP